MKKFLLSVFLVFGFISVYSQVQITLTFQGKDSLTQNYLALDSLTVTNFSENCDTLLYGPLPVLSLNAWPVGVNEINSKSSEGFIVKQNFPNPFQGSTRVNIYREYGGKLNLMLFDALGTKLAEYHNGFEKGFHSFMISSSGNKVLILVASDDKNNRSMKIISAGQGNDDHTIQYLGQTQSVEKSSLKNPDNTNSGFTFWVGNQLIYTAHANGYHDLTKFDNPTASTAYTFGMVPEGMPVTPTVLTSTILNVSENSATSGGNVISDGGTPVFFRGVCWGTNPNPTLANSYTTDGSGTGLFTSSLTNLAPNTLYYVRAYAINNVGISFGNELTLNTAFYIGSNYGGGIIFYIDGTGQHGLISATSDQSPTQWGCIGTLIGGTSSAIGSGQYNTATIVNGCSEAGIAARVCDDLVLNGYYDWFLPSKDELNQLYMQKNVVGGFVYNYYWSSFEYDADYTWAQGFGTGSQFTNLKFNAAYVRAVRAF